MTNKNSINDLFDQFSPAIVQRGGIKMLPAEDALSFVQECKRLRIIILGLDGFSLSPTSTQPSMKDSIDFTLSTTYLPPESRWDAAETFLTQKLGSKLFFEVVARE